MTVELAALVVAHWSLAVYLAIWVCVVVVGAMLAILAELVG